MDNISLAEAILKYVNEHQISHMLDISDKFVVEGDYKSLDVKVAIDELLEKKFLVLMQARKNTVRITDSGKKALQLGLKGYDAVSDDRSDRWNKIKLIVEWIAAIGGIIALLIEWL